MKQIYVIEHLEKEVYPWCLMEYNSISKIVGQSNLWFTNIKQNSKAVRELKKYGKVIEKSVKDLDLKNSCVLDPEAKQTLVPKSAKKFKYFIFGGILGDYPPKKRTKKELTKFVKGKERNLGKKQFSTDNAVFVVHEITRGKALNKMEFKNKLIIKINNIESVILPYYYPIVNGKPRISKELLALIKC
ncbi:hypothetical protein J4217_00590 [Candidatus Pacearchaeota archaeon]|nr:hypothetical protein [Candidatus Pacearchaeota archaeon]